MTYDYLVVGAGLFGSIFAHEMHKRGKKVLVIDKNNFIGGMCHTDIMYDIPIHSYGAHIFHTEDIGIWQYLNKFTNFNNYIHKVKAIYHNEEYEMPFNMNTFSKLFGVSTIDEVKNIIKITNKDISNPCNLEEQCISMVGTVVYDKLVKKYTEKQWGDECVNLPKEIIQRIPVRWNYNSNYFDDKYQGIPVNGYTPMIEKMLDGIEVRLGTFYDDTLYTIANRILYTGSIDGLFKCRYGVLDYRSLNFRHEVLNCKQYQELAVMNYTDNTPYTRTIEHKLFYNMPDKDITVVTKEYPASCDRWSDPYYPIQNHDNQTLYQKYLDILPSKIIVGGRLGNYKYCDMNTTVKDALALVKKEERINAD